MDRSVSQSVDPVLRGVHGPGVSVFGTPLDLCSQFSTETCSVPVLPWDFNIIIWLIETQSQRKPFTTLPRNFNYRGFTSVGFSEATLEPSRKFPSAEKRPTAGIPRESRDRVTRQ